MRSPAVGCSSTKARGTVERRHREGSPQALNAQSMRKRGDITLTLMPLWRNHKKLIISLLNDEQLRRDEDLLGESSDLLTRRIDGSAPHKGFSRQD